ncbi:MAG: acyl-CoA dehydrogenase family protein [Pseudomonadota bacterium]
MDFALTHDQEALRDETRRFAERELGRDLVERDRRGAIEPADWRSDWTNCADFGVLAATTPAEFGGRGLDVVSTIIMLEALGRGGADNGLTLGLNGQLWAVIEPIKAFGTDAQKKTYLPKLASGEWVGAHGMTEYETGSDAAGARATAVRDGDAYVLNGRKAYVGMAPNCDLAIVFASTSPERGSWGLSAFIVEATTPGFERSAPKQKMGLRTAPLGDIELHDCRVSDAARLGPEGAGATIFQHAMEWERSFIFASHVGAMHRQLDATVQFAASREVFGRPIDQYQSVSNRLANMKLRLETAQLLMYKAAWLKDRGRPAVMEAALAKLHLSESFVASSMDAVRIHGGKGYMAEDGIERDLRDAVGGVIYSGTSDIQRNIIAQLLKDAANELDAGTL